MSDFDQMDDSLIEAGIETLEFLRHGHRKAHCYACGDEVREAEGLLVCAECLYDDCDDYYDKAIS